MLDRRSIASWITAILLGVWVVYEAVKKPADPAAPTTVATKHSVTGTDVALPKLEVKPPELEDLRITLDRPLFSTTRRPEESGDEALDAVSAQAEPTVAPPLRLSAVIIDDQGRSALLEPENSNNVQLVREGEAIAGWKLVAVREDAVVVTAGNKRSELALRVFDAPPVPPPIRASRRNRSQQVTPTRRPQLRSTNAQLDVRETARARRERAARIQQARSTDRSGR